MCNKCLYLTCLFVTNLYSVFGSDDYKEEIVEYIERKSDKMRQAMRHMIDDEVGENFILNIA